MNSGVGNVHLMSTKNCEFREIRSSTNRSVLRCVHETPPHFLLCLCEAAGNAVVFFAFLSNRHTEGRTFVMAVNTGAVPCVCHELRCGIVHMSRTEVRYRAYVTK